MVVCHNDFNIQIDSHNKSVVRCVFEFSVSLCNTLTDSIKCKHIQSLSCLDFANGRQISPPD